MNSSLWVAVIISVIATAVTLVAMHAVSTSRRWHRKHHGDEFKVMCSHCRERFERQLR